ncbi:oligosaccharide flippase family protein [Paludibaculum fermentans]|uniref:Oligosaccharide flippase family protein n=1 Tax=Paludibaculum fermentans TaxID=1473598 RepID=A0A7S7SIM9_PALFE|nr:oligosaccharide flippase family protein [Paludibaculum fermentans]QOY86259.1 oligosaccharide flippase family protein [Paludibaculum fermentans]
MYLGYLGYELYGVWLTLGVVLAFAQFGKIGLVPAMTKHVAEEYSRRDILAIRSYATTGLLALAITGTAMFGLVMALRGLFVSTMHLSPENAAQALRLMPWIAGLSIYVLQVEALNGVLAGLGRMDVASLLQVIARIISLSIAVVLLANGIGITSLLWSNAIAYLFVHVSTLVAVRRITGCGCLSLPAFNIRRLRTLLDFGSGVFAASLVNILIAPFNKVMLARYGGVALVPVFDLSWSLSMQLRSIVDTGVSAIMPEICRLQASGTSISLKRIQSLSRRATRSAILLGLVIYGSASVCCGPLLRIWLGSRFHMLLPNTLRIILAGVLIEVASIPTYYLLLAKGRVSRVFIANVIAASINVMCVVVMVLLASAFSVTHLAIAVAASFLASTIYLLGFAKPAAPDPASSGELQLMQAGRDLVREV